MYLRFSSVSAVSQAVCVNEMRTNSLKISKVFSGDMFIWTWYSGLISRELGFTVNDNIDARLGAELEGDE